MENGWSMPTIKSKDWVKELYEDCQMKSTEYALTEKFSIVFIILGMALIFLLVVYL